MAKGGHAWLYTCLAILLGVYAASVLLSYAALWALAAVLSVLWLLLAWFFRDPERTPGEGIVSPADGKVIAIETMNDPDLGEAERISIFMSPLDVHVNRFPCDGEIARVVHHPGKHIPAFDKDSERNERVETLLQTPDGPLKVVQITGAVARRIVPYYQGGTHVKGSRMGLIRLGSRADVYVPAGTVSWHVTPGQRVWAGRTSIASRRAP